MKTKISLLLYCFLVVACVEEKGTEEQIEEKSSKKQILSYTIEAEKNDLYADICGMIDEKKQIITLDSKVPVNKNLIATFDAIGEVYIGNIPQISGETSNGYSSDLTYTVVAENGSTITYMVKSDPMTMSSKNTITDFRIDVVQQTKRVIQGTINDQSSTITLNVPSNDWIDNIENVIATFTSKGIVKIDNIKQTSGITPNDYRNELVYTVTAEDNPEKKYRVILVSPQSTGLPVVKIDTENNAEIRDKENYVKATFTLADAVAPENDLEKKETGIRGRGNSTWGYPKKPYRLKFDKKVSMFGLGEAKSWVLLANYLDPTLIMNTVALELGHRVGLSYTNHAHHVEFFLNGKYQGSYVLTEQVQVDKYRVNMDEKTDFLVELDSYYDEPIKFRTPLLGLPINVKSPEVTNESEIEFVKTAMNELEEAVFGTASNFPGSYKNLIDINSFVNFLLVTEVVRNNELQHPKSTYMYKRKGEKICMGPLWDFDWAFGYKERGQNYFGDAKTMLHYNRNVSMNNIGTYFFTQFFKDPEFRLEYKKRWNEVKESISDMDNFVQEKGNYLRKSAIENKERWTDNLDHTTQINNMRTWLKERIAYLDTQINKF
ncbi:hypothetical protein EZS27_019882 [termite gut metagenome]|uniref:CotH protein n=1 Tax=termite gut metagenome TaxID=433724 RepID=A0A5J4RCQ4_9ZZZZ